MAYGKQLLDLTLEYKDSVAGNPEVRSPGVIAEEYESVLLRLVTTHPSDTAPASGDE